MNRDRDVIREPTDEDYKWATQDMNKDRDIVLELGGCWHERISSRLCSCGFVPTGFEIIESHISYNNPDFTSDVGKVQLLREMEKREDWSEFLHSILEDHTNDGNDATGIYFNVPDSWIMLHLFSINLILDTTGKLQDAAWEWLRKEATDEPT